MRKKFKVTLEKIILLSNLSSSDTIKNFFNSVSYILIKSGIDKLNERNELSLSITDQFSLDYNINFHDKFLNDIMHTSIDIINEIENNPFTDIFNHILEECYLINKKGNGLAQYLTPQKLANGALKFLINDKEETYTYRFAEPCGGTGALIFPFLKRMYDKDKYGELNKVEIIYNDKDPFIAQLFTSQILTNMVYNDICFKKLFIYVSDAITEYDGARGSVNNKSISANTLFLGVECK